MPKFRIKAINMRLIKQYIVIGLLCSLKYSLKILRNVKHAHNPQQRNAATYEAVSTHSLQSGGGGPPNSQVNIQIRSIQYSELSIRFNRIFNDSFDRIYWPLGHLIPNRSNLRIFGYRILLLTCSEISTMPFHVQPMR